MPMTTTDVAKSLGLSQKTVQNQIAAGVLRATKVGRDWHVTAREVERYRVEHRRGAK